MLLRLWLGSKCTLCPGAAHKPTRSSPRRAPRPVTSQEVKDLLAGVGEMDGAALGALITRFGIKAPDTKNDLSPPFPFNLMFKVC